MINIQMIATQVLAEAPAEGFNPLSLLMPLLMLAGMYFLLIAPQRKRQKELEKLQGELAVGDNVIAAAGIYGRVVSIAESTVTLEIESGRIVVHKSTISGKAEDAAKALQA